MVVATDGVIAAVAVITTGGAEVAAITMVGDITAITGDLYFKGPGSKPGPLSITALKTPPFIAVSYWQRCGRPSSPRNNVPGWQTKPLRRAYASSYP